MAQPPPTFPLRPKRNGERGEGHTGISNVLNLLVLWKFSRSTKARGRGGVKTGVPLLASKRTIGGGAIGSGLHRIIVVDDGGGGWSSEGILPLPGVDSHGAPRGSPHTETFGILPWLHSLSVPSQTAEFPVLSLCRDLVQNQKKTGTYMSPSVWICLPNPSMGQAQKFICSDLYVDQSLRGSGFVFRPLNTGNQSCIRVHRLSRSRGGEVRW